MNALQFLKVLVIIFLDIILYNEVQCRRIQISDENDVGSLNFLKLFESISRTRETNLPTSAIKRKYLGNSHFDMKYLNSLASDATQFKRANVKKPYEQAPPKAPIKDDLATLIEKELRNVLSKKSSALLNIPYLQKKGRNDFLVLRQESDDPFVTIIPNDIYYNVEKKCINWLDDCNQRGLRNRLLQKVNSPF